MFWIGLVFTGMLFSLVVWSVGVAVHLLFPEEPGTTEDELGIWLHQLTNQPQSVPVGAREITLAKRMYQRKHLHAPYEYSNGVSTYGVPENWLEDIYRRQN